MFSFLSLAIQFFIDFFTKKSNQSLLTYLSIAWIPPRTYVKGHMTNTRENDIFILYIIWKKSYAQEYLLSKN